ncbi:hypothetical protein ACFLWN_00740 [Chloroflexota bacterium]
MNRILLELRDILASVFLYLTLLFVFLSFLRDVVLVSLRFRMDYLLLVILVIWGLYGILGLKKGNSIQANGQAESAHR